MLVSFMLTMSILSGYYPDQNVPPAECRYEPDDPIMYEEIRERAINACKNRKSEDVDLKVIDNLIEIEKTFDVPMQLRGMVLAAACVESGYGTTLKGDYRINRRGGESARAIGILQLWPWWEKSIYHVNRFDHKASARAWMSHITKQLPKVKRSCKHHSSKRVWIAAWVTAIRAPREGGRCNEKPLHLKVLKKWHKNIRKARRKCFEESYPCGC